MMIIEKCNGLPLAIKVIGGVLTIRSPTRDSWFVILNHILGSEAQSEVIFSSLYLSYQDLSPQLKQCFLYYSLLPKGVNFDSPNVINMWISEGFIHLAAGRAHELEDIGTEYHQDLIMRHLIEPGASSSMHDIVRSFAQHMTREEALVVQRELQTEISSHLLSNFRRLSIESAESVPVEWADLQKLVLLRVLIINRTVNFKPGDSLSSFSSLRVLHIVRLAGSNELVRSLCQLKHLRYLYLYDSDISSLPDDIHRMKFLQHIGIVNCERFVQLPVNIIKLTQLRSLDLVGSSVDVVPRGFGRLTNLRSLFGFPVHRDGEGQGWCSLEELAPLRKLRSLRLEGIEKVNVSYLAEKAMISSMEHLISLHLNCSKSISVDVTNSEEQFIQEVYKHLSPPHCVENIVMETYIGRRLPNWMWAPEAAAFRRLRYMVLRNLASCTKLPDGLCQIPFLKRLEINKAPRIKHVGPEFLHHGGLQCAFPSLQELILLGMVKWCGWVWDPLNDVQAMPALEVLLVERCRLRSFPPGLSCHARALRRLVIAHALRLESLEAFLSLVELDICLSPRLSKIANLPRLQKLTVKICTKLSVLEGVPALRSLLLEDYTMKTLPGYLQRLQDDVCPKYLTLDCTIKLLKSISMRKGGPEWPKISHIQQVNAYAEDGGHQRKWSVLYTREPFSFKANMPDSDSDSEENLADDKLVRSDIPSDGSTDSQTDDELDDNNDIRTVSTGVDPFYDDSELVGIESPRDQIIEMLMNGRHTDKQQLQVVSIYGIGGLGKTTIAKSVGRQISNRFDCCAYVSVSQRPEDIGDIVSMGIMKSIIEQVRCPYPNLQDNLQVMINILKQFLEDKRYLIVIDDIWEASVWETIKAAFIGNNHGSGIIATTYKVDVAESIGGVYTLPLLSD
ncbi:putative disease resistance protein RGA3 [Panicum miliaceum]|uniref:Disease resistance protein RGA3 n=1 Tax=Panicum miliaceum TaxID=4540 RepID=A0A3L6TLV0_PANMI|nr:putative disease resistance protein RGA3 [Panicum miliaceum]